MENVKAVFVLLGIVGFFAFVISVTDANTQFVMALIIGGSLLVERLRRP